MQYILTQDELDALKNEKRAIVSHVMTILSEHLVTRTVCLDIGVGQETVIFPKDFKHAVKKTIEYYAK